MTLYQISALILAENPEAAGPAEGTVADLHALVGMQG